MNTSHMCHDRRNRRQDQTQDHAIERVNVRNDAREDPLAPQTRQSVAIAPGKTPQKDHPERRKRAQCGVMGQKALSVAGGGASEGRKADTGRRSKDVKGDADAGKSCKPRGGDEPPGQAEERRTHGQDNDRQDSAPRHRPGIGVHQHDGDLEQASHRRKLHLRVHGRRQIRIVGCHDDRPTSGLERLQRPDDPTGGFGIEVGRRLVRQDQLGPAQNGARQKQPAGLAA